MYKFKVKKARHVTQSYPKVNAPLQPPAEQVGPVQGILPKSKEEYRVAKALDRMGLRYLYQYDVLFGRSRPGGQVIDFWVYTVPLPTPLYVNGSYWHQKNSAEEALNLGRLTQMYKGLIRPPLQVWDYELMSTEMAYQTLRRALG